MLPAPAPTRIRPIREADAAAYGSFLAGLSGTTRRSRFMTLAEAPTEELVRFHTRVDHRRHIAFGCEAELDGGPAIVGDARCIANADGRSCELGIVVADNWHHTGIAQQLMAALMDAARVQGYETMAGLVMSENSDMLDFVRELGFSTDPTPQAQAMVRVVRKL